MNVCVVGPTYPYRGGIAHYSTLLVQHLRAAGHDVSFYSYSRQYPTFLFPGRTDRDPSAQPLNVDCEYVLDSINPVTWWHLVERIRDDDPDAVILQWWVPFWAPALTVIGSLLHRRTDAVVVFICHNVMPHSGESLLSRLAAKTALRHGDVLVVHSATDRQIASTLLPGKRIIRSYHPTYAPLRLPQQETLSEVDIRRRLSIADGIPTLLFFGFVRPYKGLSYLIEALPKVRRHIDVQLVVAGEFWSSPNEYRRRANALGVESAVAFIDQYIPNEDLSAYFDLADVVVLPYTSATQSGVVQIAFGFEKPVITTAVGGLTEVVEDGVTGIIVPPCDSLALADAILLYFSGTVAERLTHNVRTLTQEKFSWQRLVSTLEIAITRETPL